MMSNLTVIETASPRPALMAGHRPAAIVPQSMEEAYRLANAVCQANMAPKGLDTPEKALVAIMHGLEIGLTPMAALQRIAVVNGRPTIWGDGAIGLVRGSGLCEWVKERIDGAGDDRVAICEAKRKGDPESISRRFSVADAKRAGLWGKAGPWQQYPERMLQMRARAFALRDGFADVLGGLYLKEEIEDAIPAKQSNQPPIPPTPPAIVHQVEAPAEKIEEATAVDMPPVPPKPPTAPVVTEVAFDFGLIFDRFTKAAKAAQDMDALTETWETIVGPHEDDLLPPEHEDCMGVYRSRERELAP